MFKKKFNRVFVIQIFLPKRIVITLRMVMSFARPFLVVPTYIYVDTSIAHLRDSLWRLIRYPWTEFQVPRR